MNLDNPKIRELITLASDNGHVVRIMANVAFIDIAVSDIDCVAFHLLFDDVYFYAFTLPVYESVYISENKFRLLISECVHSEVINAG